MKIYVGNLPYSMDSEGLRKAFAEHGAVDTADVVVDRDTNRSRGFGFVEMSNDEEAKAAINALNGKDYDGRALKVNEARPKTDAGPRRSNFRY
jgi:RNA recognition motif-containing protein